MLLRLEITIKILLDLVSFKELIQSLLQLVMHAASITAVVQSMHFSSSHNWFVQIFRQVTIAP